MANRTIRFFDVTTQSAIDIRAVDLGDGTYALATNGGAGLADLSIGMLDVESQELVPVRAVDLGDGTYAMATAEQSATGLIQAKSMPGLYNASGLERYFRQRQNAGKNAAGTGFGSCVARIIGDSFSKGYNQTHPYRDTFPYLVHTGLQRLPWQTDPGGRGYLSCRSGSTAWPGGAATLSGQAIWIFGGTWTTTSAASINNLRCTCADTATPGRARVFMAGSTEARDFREQVTDLALVYGKESGGGTLRWDIKYAATDTGFFTPGTGDLTGTISCAGAAAGGIFEWLTLTNHDPAQSFILQVAPSAGTIYLEGAYFCNGDKSSGMHGFDCSRAGAASQDATFPGGEAANVATIDRGCTYGGTCETNTALYIWLIGINDCVQENGTAAFAETMDTAFARVNSASSGRASNLMVAMPCFDEGLYTSKVPPWNEYKEVMQEVVAGNSAYSAYFSLDELLDDPDTAAEVNVYEAAPYRYSTDAAKHPTDEGAAWMASALVQVLGMPFAT